MVGTLNTFDSGGKEMRAIANSGLFGEFIIQNQMMFSLFFLKGGFGSFL